MENYQILKSYQKLLKYFVLLDKVKRLERSSLCYFKEDSSPYWNFALVKDNLDREEILKIEKEFRLFKRDSTIYFEMGKNSDKIENLLKNEGYVKIFEDSFQFWERGLIEDLNIEDIKVVKTLDDAEVFIRTYDECYGVNDDQNPYGKFSETFLQLLKRVWEKYNEKYIECYIVYNQNEPVGVGMLVKSYGLGYLTAIGSKKSVRGQGFGKKITFFAVNRALKEGLVPFLGTEEGYYPNEFYRKIGFKSKFNALYYFKKL